MAGIIRYLKNEILNLIPTKFQDKTLTSTNFLGFAKYSFSQEGEDMILSKLLEGVEKGFFLDIGAHHPFRFSNTYSFYLKGWRGINIDAMPESMTLFNKYRNEDINLEIPIAKQKRILPFYTYNESALNTFSENLANERGEPKKVYQLEANPLSDILDKYLPSNIKNIDFMSVDVEGLDLEVLESNNWDKYKPTIIAIESLVTANDIFSSLNSEVAIYLNSKNYSLCSKSDNTLFFRLKD
ncbi:MAG: FkbM family methyltransferase [Bacteroidales bacterium]